MLSTAGIHHKIKNALSSRSARAWLLKRGWNWKEVRKGIYKDGHERGDVKDYRNTLFLPQLAVYKARIMEWDENLEVIPKDHGAGVNPLVFIINDESTFNSNDGHKKI